MLNSCVWTLTGHWIRVCYSDDSVQWQQSECRDWTLFRICQLSIFTFFLFTVQWGLVAEGRTNNIVSLQPSSLFTALQCNTVTGGRISLDSLCKLTTFHFHIRLHSVIMLLHWVTVGEWLSEERRERYQYNASPCSALHWIFNISVPKLVEGNTIKYQQQLNGRLVFCCIPWLFMEHR